MKQNIHVHTSKNQQIHKKTCYINTILYNFTISIKIKNLSKPLIFFWIKNGTSHKNDFKYIPSNFVH